MAGRYLLIEFDDAESANALRTQIDSASRKGKKYRAVGLFAIPGPTFCDCGKETSTRTEGSSLKRGKKFGWWVCSICKKPSTMMRLNNLIGVEEIISPRLTKRREALTKQLVDLIHYPLSIELPTRLYSSARK